MTASTEKLWELDRENGTVVFVLGAGCSADCGAPTMAQFMRTARKYSRERDLPFSGEYDEMFRFRRSCLRLSYVFDRWWENIEDLFTQAHLKYLIDEKKNGPLYEAMKRVIWDVYRRRLPDHIAFVGYDSFAACLQKMANPKKPRPVVLTTNYDLHLETSLARGHTMLVDTGGARSARVVVQGIPVYPGMNNEWKVKPEGSLCSLEDASGRWSFVSSTVDTRFYEIIKLHGSVNWFRGDRDDEAVCDSKTAQSYSAKRKTKLKHFNCQDAWDRETMSDPLIVPPLLGKAALPSVIAAQWKRALHAFSFARLIVVAGYSFPETDTFMTRLMAEGIRENDELEGFVIVNSNDTDIWRNRVEQMFAQSWLRNTVEWCHKPFSAFAKELLSERTTDSPAIDTIRSITAM